MVFYCFSATAEQARKEWKAHIAQLREKQGRVLKSEDLEASQP